MSIPSLRMLSRDSMYANRCNDVTESTGTGSKIAYGKHYEFDVIAIATSLDITMGGMIDIGLKSIKGTTLQDEWNKAAYTYLATTISGYPNMFHLSGPSAATAQHCSPIAYQR